MLHVTQTNRNTISNSTNSKRDGPKPKCNTASNRQLECPHLSWECMSLLRQTQWQKQPAIVYTTVAQTQTSAAFSLGHRIAVVQQLLKKRRVRAKNAPDVMMMAAENDSFQARYEGAGGTDHEAEIVEKRYPLSTIQYSLLNPTSKGSKAARRPTECRDPCPRRFLSERGGPDQQAPRPTEAVGHHAGLHNLTIQTRKRYMSRMRATIEIFHNTCCLITHLWPGCVKPLAISMQTFRLVPSKRCWTSFCLKTISR